MRSPMSCIAHTVAILLALGGHGCAESAGSDQATVLANRAAVLKELGARKLAAGPHPDTAITLAAQDGARTATTASVVVAADGRIIVLIKTRIQPKGNYDGCLFSDQPIPAAEIDNDAYGRKQIHALDTVEPNPPVIIEKVDPACYRVIFDLG